jgi:hypothetical protein
MKSIRQRTWDRVRGKCAYCGGVLYWQTFRVDHVIPQSHGGKHTLDNYLACCPKCNTRKRDKTIAELKAFLSESPRRHLEEIHKQIRLIPWKLWQTDTKRVTAAADKIAEAIDLLGQLPVRFWYEHLDEQAVPP